MKGWIEVSHVRPPQTSLPRPPAAGDNCKPQAHDRPSGGSVRPRERRQGRGLPGADAGRGDGEGAEGEFENLRRLFYEAYQPKVYQFQRTS